MKYFLISDNTDTQAGMALVGVNGVVVHTPAEVEAELAKAVADPDVGIVLLTEKLARDCRETVYGYKLRSSRPLLVTMSHNKLAAQIVRQAKLSDKAGDAGEKFGVVFCAMGVTNDVADYFRRSFAESGAESRVTMFMNLSSDPIIERILTPRCALTAAEYLAFEQNMSAPFIGWLMCQGRLRGQALALGGV